MSLGEEIFMRFAVGFLAAGLILGFRLIIALLKKGWNALTGNGEKPRQEPKIQAKQPPKPPVIPGQTANTPVVPQPPKPPVVPQSPVVPKPPVAPQPPVVPQPPKPPVVPQSPKPSAATAKPQEYKGTVPLDPEGAVPLAGQQSSGSGYSLRCVRGPMQGQRFPIPKSGCTIGRSPDCSIRFPAQTPGVSGRHCKIEAMYFCAYPVANGYNIYLQDVGSTYGTYSGFGQRIPAGEQHPLGIGEAFFLGNPNGPGFVLEKQ